MSARRPVLDYQTKATGTAGGAALALVWTASQFGLDMSLEVALGFVAGAMFLVSWLTPGDGRRRAP